MVLIGNKYQLDYMSNSENMDCIKDLVKKELSKSFVNTDSDCKYYPCHYMGQNCTFCYCPFYPCNDEEVGGNVIVTSKGDLAWSCKHCLFIHDHEIAEYVHHRLRIDGIDNPEALAELFKEVKRRFFYPEREHWDSLRMKSKESTK